MIRQMGTEYSIGGCNAQPNNVHTVAQKTVPMFGHFVMFGL